uniref:Uncharacterized protein n=1 Tax=Utricularia reniformis TaxID=192314 RepID=A0A1Y0AZ06_9LAMI|nr:hypothetical protein AEK19_MT1525 [Utricularia reniformis]ART30385.1 hypothetical protein AEK19_MT1525 [Utricularia reniformis]
MKLNALVVLYPRLCCASNSNISSSMVTRLLLFDIGEKGALLSSSKRLMLSPT